MSEDEPTTINVPVQLKVGDGALAEIGHIAYDPKLIPGFDDMLPGEQLLAMMAEGLRQTPGVLRSAADDFEEKLPELMHALGVQG